jgi:hypothetical protein
MMTMQRQPPRRTDEIDLYVRTYYSLLRSSGDVWVRTFEEAHLFSGSSLHAGARDPAPDVAAFAYSAARLPECMPHIARLVLGQTLEHFELDGLRVGQWQRVSTRGRRRPLRWDGQGTLAAFVTSASDIDDLVPIVTAYQIEWNKMHHLLAGKLSDERTEEQALIARVGELLSLGPEEVARLRGALGPDWRRSLMLVAQGECDLRMRLLSGSFLEYQRSANRWWSAIGPRYQALAGGASTEGRRGQVPPVYFVSSNTHSLLNLLGGYARTHRSDILRFVEKRDPEQLAPVLRQALDGGDEASASNLLYYLLRQYLHEPGHREARLREVQEEDARSGIVTVEHPGHLDVDAQIIPLRGLDAGRLDPRVCIPGVERLRDSKAVILNIDYPLGLSAYHHLAAVAEGVGELRGLYVMGKAATLNGRVGDVMIASTVYDEHSRNSYVFPNVFTAADVQPFMRRGTVLDNQRAVTVRSAFLQNHSYMSEFYQGGYSVLEMEAGPYLSAAYEIVNPRRHPEDELVHFARALPFDLGILHYASDTPYSRRQSLLSKSMSFFGVESTYACALAIVRRILSEEIARLS